MKLLRIDARFALPEDWSGSAADALRELASFLDDPTRGLDALPPTCGWAESQTAFVNNWNNGIRFTGAVSVFEANPPTWRWSRIDESKSMPRVHFCEVTPCQKAGFCK